MNERHPWASFQNISAGGNVHIVTRIATAAGSRWFLLAGFVALSAAVVFLAVSHAAPHRSEREKTFLTLLDRAWQKLGGGRSPTITEYTRDGEALSDAAGALTEAEKIDPSAPRLHKLWGNLHEARGDLAAAEQSYAKAIALDRDYVVADVALANLQLRRHQGAAALRTLEAARAKHPSSSFVYVALCNALEQEKGPWEAEPICSQAVTLNPKSYQSRLNYGAVLFELDELEAAELQFLKAKELNDHDSPDRRRAAPLVAVGRVYQKRGQLEDARRMFEEASRVQPSEPNAYINLAALLAQANDWSAAARVLEDGNTAAPWSTELLKRLAVAYDHVGQPQLAEMKRRESDASAN